MEDIIMVIGAIVKNLCESSGLGITTCDCVGCKTRRVRINEYNSGKPAVEFLGDVDAKTGNVSQNLDVRAISSLYCKGDGL